MQLDPYQFSTQSFHISVTQDSQTVRRLFVWRMKNQAATALPLPPPFTFWLCYQNATENHRLQENYEGSSSAGVEFFHFLNRFGKYSGDVMSESGSHLFFEHSRRTRRSAGVTCISFWQPVNKSANRRLNWHAASLSLPYDSWSLSIGQSSLDFFPFICGNWIQRVHFALSIGGL